MNAAFAHMQAQMQAQLQAQMAAGAAAHALQMQAVHDAYAAGAVPAFAAHAPAAHQRGPKLANLARYDGATPPLDEWAAQVRQHYAYYRTQAGVDQVGYAAAHLAGPALDWLESLGHAALADWAALEAGLRARFQPITSAERARTHLDALRQGKASVFDYVAAYRRIAVALPTTDAATMLHAFRRGLRTDLAAYVYQYNPATIEDAIQLVVRMGAAGSLGGAGAGVPMDLASSCLGGEEPAAASGGDLVTRDELAMMLAAMQNGYRSGGDHRGGGGFAGVGAQQRGQLPVIKGMTETQVKEYMAAGKCFACASTAHTSRGCHLRRRDPSTGKITWDSAPKK